MEPQPAATVRAPEGMVCAVDHLASGAGVAMLRAGGSAADAAVATSAVLAVTTQHMCGMGGDLLAIVVPAGGTPVGLNASGRAGSGANAQELRDEGHTTMPFHDIRAVTVPGCVDGWLALHGRFGRLPLADVLAPARHYAANGFPPSPTLDATMPIVATLPDAADLTQRVDDLIRRPGVARALDDIVGAGRNGFYLGEFGAGLIQLGEGLFTRDDLAVDQSNWVAALSIEAWGHRVWTVPPNSQGYLTLSSAWIAAGLDLPDDPKDPLWAHLLIESSRQAARDRIDVLHEHADGDALLDPARLQPRRDAIDRDRAAVLNDSYAGGGTIALCAVDRDRMGVCVVQSNASGYGSNVIVPGVRIFLHNRGIGFRLEPGHPAELAPGRRPCHTLCPTAVTTPSGALRGVVGSMGGDGQPQILLQLLARWLHDSQAPGPAVAAGRFVLAGMGGGFDTWERRGEVQVLLEGNAPPAWRDGLGARGHVTREAAAFSHDFGHAHLISVEGGALAGATDPRPRFGAAAGY